MPGSGFLVEKSGDRWWKVFRAMLRAEASPFLIGNIIKIWGATSLYCLWWLGARRSWRLY